MLGGGKKSKKLKDSKESNSVEATPPKLVSRRANRKSTLISGRTIGERREKLETASERTAAREKVKKKKTRRIVTTVIFYIALAVLVVFLGVKLFSRVSTDEAEGDDPLTSTTIVVPYTPTIEVIDEDSSATGGRITSRMKEYIGQAEADFRELNYTPIKAVVPSGAVREVDFYLEGYTGYIKLTIDRGTGVSVEDADRMLRYLTSIDIHDFVYIDVRIDGKAYWK